MIFLIAVGVCSSVAFSARILAPTLTLSFRDLLGFVILLLIAACLGLMLAVFPGAMLLGIVFSWVEWRNGAPFHEGDEVVILSKRFPGRITRVYAVWPERHQVRVEVGDIERHELTDLFSYVEVCRLPSSK